MNDIPILMITFNRLAYTRKAVAAASIAKGGAIVMHDCNPHSERITHVPRDNGEWCGDVYRAASALQYDHKFTVDMDYGCMVIRKFVAHRRVPAFSDEVLDMSYEIFDKNRDGLLHLVTVDRAKKLINAWT